MKKLRIFSIVLACLIYAFLILEWLQPVSSLVIYMTAVVVSIIEIICLIFYIKKNHSLHDILIFVFGLIPSIVMLGIFAVGFIMGM